PGSTPPDASFTTPVMAANVVCAEPVDGNSNKISRTPQNRRKTLTIASSSPVCRTDTGVPIDWSLVQNALKPKARPMTRQCQASFWREMLMLRRDPDSWIGLSNSEEVNGL